MVASQTVTAERGRSGAGSRGSVLLAVSALGDRGKQWDTEAPVLPGPCVFLEGWAFSHHSGTSGTSSRALGFLQAAIPSLPPHVGAPAGPRGPRDTPSPPPGCAQARGALPVRLCLPVCVSVSVLDIVAAARAPGRERRHLRGSCGKGCHDVPVEVWGPLSSSQMAPRRQRGGYAAYRPLRRSPQGTAMTAMTAMTAGDRRQSARPMGAEGGRWVKVE